MKKKIKKSYKKWRAIKTRKITNQKKPYGTTLSTDF